MATGVAHQIQGTTADIGYVESTTSFIVGASLAQQFKVQQAVGRSLVQQFGVQAAAGGAVGRSLVQQFKVTTTVGKSVQLKFGVAGIVGASLAQPFKVESTAVDVVAVGRIQRLQFSRDRSRGSDVARAQALLTARARQHAGIP